MPRGLAKVLSAPHVKFSYDKEIHFCVNLSGARELIRLWAKEDIILTIYFLKFQVKILFFSDFAPLVFTSLFWILGFQIMDKKISLVNSIKTSSRCHIIRWWKRIIQWSWTMYISMVLVSIVFYKCFFGQIVFYNCPFKACDASKCWPKWCWAGYWHQTQAPTDICYNGLKIMFSFLFWFSVLEVKKIIYWRGLSNLALKGCSIIDLKCELKLVMDLTRYIKMGELGRSKMIRLNLIHLTRFNPFPCNTNLVTHLYHISRPDPYY